jgi:hypothetical protein
MKLINKDSEAIERRLHQSMRNKELFELMNLGKSLVYLSTGINANQLVLERFKRLDIYKKFEEDIALLEDALIENRQAMEMCSVHVIFERHDGCFCFHYQQQRQPCHENIDGRDDCFDDSDACRQFLRHECKHSVCAG